MPKEIILLGHKDISRKPFSSAQRSGSHIKIVAEKGGHTSELLKLGAEEGSLIRHESWTAGTVHWPSGRITSGGALLNLGEKTAPMPGMDFLNFSGLWGTREETGLFSTLRSGYWGPAFNETGMGSKGFMSAWCTGMADPNRYVLDPIRSETVRECYANVSNP